MYVCLCKAVTDSEIREHVELEHPRGAMGLLTRLLFARPNLFMLFVYRRLRTRRGLRPSA